MVLINQIDEIYKEIGSNNVEIPTHITNNLKFDLREYQIKALKNYMINDKFLKQNHIMFNMATGSGKTIIMASLILNEFVNGYENFIFFVNSTSVLEKTKENFINEFSSKYLFNNEIIINDKRISLNLINSLNDSKAGCINIYFDTIQGLFSLFRNEKENSITLNDLKGLKLILLSDEAHHINADTKNKNLTKEEKELKESWESIVNKIFKSNENNKMFEFSATIPNDENVQEKYESKIVFKYELSQFCKDGYSKRIFLIKHESEDIKNRFLSGILLSLYKELIAQKHNIFLKPVILFKSNTIKSSSENLEIFLKFIDEIDENLLNKFYASVDKKENETLFKSYEFFKNFGISKLIHLIKIAFKKEFILNANNESEKEKLQILLNTLETKNNSIRVIFAVDKLNEGWDVLNLFDIIRLDDPKNSYTTTTKEAQLIGRGARIFPFLKPKFKRKFDNDQNNELSVLEKLHYHTTNEPKFINNLNKAMSDMGLEIEAKLNKIVLKPKENLKKVAKNVFYAKNNRFVKKELVNYFITDKEISYRMDKIFIPLISDSFKEEEQNFKNKNSSDEFKIYKNLEFIDDNIFLKAMAKVGLTHKQIYQDLRLNSKSEFIKFIKSKLVNFNKAQIFNDKNLNLKIALYVLNNYKKISSSIKNEYVVDDFKTYKLNLDEKTIMSKKEPKSGLAYEWLYYENYTIDSALERDFLNAIDCIKNEISKIFKSWFIIRNENFNEFKIYDNRENSITYGVGFEPDFVLFGKKEKDEFYKIQMLLECKGDHLVHLDRWKSEFLKYLDNKEFSISGDKNLKILGMDFFTKNKEHEFNAKLIEKLDI